MVTTIRRQETTAEALTRLAQKARDEGVKLYQSRSTGGYVATSGTRQGKSYAVTGFSCECQGFSKYHRCKHYAALQTALGFIDRPGETPVASPADTCRDCDGRGYHIKARNIGRGQFVREDVPCPSCDGAGIAVKVVA